MGPEPNVPHAKPSEARHLLGYVADLELEVDRLRKQDQFVREEVRAALKRVWRLCAGGAGEKDGQPALAEIDRTVRHLAAALRDLQEPPGYHPAHDQVIAIAVRPLAEQVFRRQRRLTGAPEVVLRLELECEHVEWFPARLKHVLDNLISNALKYRDPDKAEQWVRLGLRESPQAYEIRVSDNGVGLPPGGGAELSDLFYRSAPTRAAGLGVGLSVVRMLVEQSGGTLTSDSGEGHGTTFTAVLPRYEVDDFLT